MRRRSLLALVTSLAVPRVAGAENTASVVTSFSILADMVREIGGNTVSVRSLVPPDGDAHEYQPTPEDLRLIHDAAVLVENGLGLEGWITRLPQAVGFRGELIVAAKGVTPRRIKAGAGTAIDPHAWQDPQNGIRYVREIAHGLGHAIPHEANAMMARADAYIAQIEALDGWIATQFAEIPAAKRRILTSHDAFGYYGARYGIELLSVQGISTDSEPSASDIAALIGQIKRLNIRAVFVENMTNAKFAATIAHDTGAKLGNTVYSDAMSAKDGPAPTYLEMLRYNTEQFVAAMRG
jgi:zinc/manganese transport system substrate-binding protein